MPTPDDKDWEELTDFQRVNLKPWELQLYREAIEEDFLEMARESMEESIHRSKQNLAKKKRKSEDAREG